VKRREFLAQLTGAAVLWPLSSRAQEPAVPVVGFLASWSPDAYGQRVLSAFRQGLAETGFIENKNIEIDARWAEGHYDRLRALAAGLVRRRVRVIVTSGTSATIAARAETATIPIVFITASDPVALGLVSSLGRPGGNLTGVANLGVELGPKRLQLLHELSPAATTMALLTNPTNATLAERQRKATEVAARELGLKLHIINATDERGISEAFATALKLEARGLLIAVDAVFTKEAANLGALTVRYKMPAIQYLREFVAAGGLMSYSGSTVEYHNVAGSYTGRILKGEKPADLAVQQPTKTELSINVATAKTLGIAIPPPLLARADEVVE
jgi:putative ABC transport system substrate-binding protein